MSVKETVEKLAAKMKENPEHLGNLNSVFQLQLSGDEGGVYQLKVENQTVEVIEEQKYEPNITLEMSDNNFIKLANSSLNPTMAYMSGKLKVKGDLALALKLNAVIQKYNK